MAAVGIVLGALSIAVVLLILHSQARSSGQSGRRPTSGYSISAGYGKSYTYDEDEDTRRAKAITMEIEPDTLPETGWFLEEVPVPGEEEC